MVCHGNELRSFCHIGDCIQILHFGLSCWLCGYSISSKGFLPTVYIMVILFNSPIPVYFTLLIPKMSKFTFATSYLTMSNTFFQQHKTRLYTWTSPDGQYQNQTDYILCSWRWRSSIQSAKRRLGADCGSDHELPIAKFRLKLKKVGEANRPFRYDLNQIPYDYTVEVRNRFKGSDLIDRVPDELWNEVRDIVQETGIKTIPMEKKCFVLNTDKHSLKFCIQMAISFLFSFAFGISSFHSYF